MQLLKQIHADVSDNLSPKRIGRPRVSSAPQDNGSLTPREQILQAAAELFTTQGYSATSTRTIAEKVGIRQASLYYHFASKDDILLELLQQSVTPSCEYAFSILHAWNSDSIGPMEALFQLAKFDTHLLVTSSNNIGMLYLLPEIQAEQFAEFRAKREQLRFIYGDLSAAILADLGPGPLRLMTPAFLGTMILDIVESVVIHRINNDVIKDLDNVIPVTCLLSLGVSAEYAESFTRKKQ